MRADEGEAVVGFQIIAHKAVFGVRLADAGEHLADFVLQMAVFFGGQRVGREEARHAAVAVDESGLQAGGEDAASGVTEKVTSGWSALWMTQRSGHPEKAPTGAVATEKEVRRLPQPLRKDRVSRPMARTTVPAVTVRRVSARRMWGPSSPEMCSMVVFS